jgi:CHRD domain-containing protein
MGRTILAAAATAAVCALVLGSGAASGDGARSSKLGDRAFFAVLKGSNETSGGDRNGKGSASVTFDGTQLCWGITVANLSRPVGAHIHKAKRGKDGAIVVPLEQPADGDPGASSGCTTVSAALARAIRRNPGGYYVNVHSDQFGAGAIRGQLFGED